MVTDTAKTFLQVWRTCKIAQDLEDLKFHVSQHDSIQGPERHKVYEEYQRSTEQIKAIKDERFAPLIKDILEPRPDGELTLEGYAIWKEWKARNDAAEEKLSEAILELK